MLDKNPYAASQVATARQPALGAQGQSRDFGIGEVLGIGFGAVMKQPVELIGGFGLTLAITWIVQQLPHAALMFGALPADGLGGLVVVPLISGTLGAILSAYFGVGQVRAALTAARGEPVEFGQFFSGGDRFGTAFLVNLMTAVGVVIGVMLLIVPGLILAVGWTLSAAFVADTDCSASEALGESWEMTKGRRLQLLLFVFASVFVVFLGLLCLVIGFFVAAPVVAVAYATIYVRITGNTQSQLAA